MKPTPASPAPDGPAQPLVIRIELGGCDDKAGLLARIAAALHFPDWFGHNWDALADCLGDLSWLPAPGWRVEFADAGTLRQAAPETYATLVAILDEAHDGWAAAGRRFDYALIADHPRPASAPPARPR